MLSQNQQLLLQVLQDKTRMRILELLSDNPQHPEILVKETKISRTAIEKHLKLLLKWGLIERRAQTVPRLRYIYSITYEAELLVSNISTATDSYIENMVTIWEEELSRLDQSFVYGHISKEEYKKLKEDYESRLSEINEE